MSGSHRRYREGMGSVETDMTMTASEKFAAWLAPAMRRAGLNIDSLRGGGRIALAKAVGVAPSTVNRWLAGQTMPTPEQFEPIATAVGVDTVDMLTEIGIISPQLATEQRNPAVRLPPMTPSQLADEAGIRDPVERQLFEVFLRGLTRTPEMPASQGEEEGEADERQRG